MNRYSAACFGNVVSRIRAEHGEGTADYSCHKRRCSGCKVPQHVKGGRVLSGRFYCSTCSGYI